ncbi:hypothetical protein U1Q18_052030, partial [Sarracenia purpurea var. burkii]
SLLLRKEPLIRKLTAKERATAKEAIDDEGTKEEGAKEGTKESVRRFRLQHSTGEWEKTGQETAAGDIIGGPPTVKSKKKHEKKREIILGPLPFRSVVFDAAVIPPNQRDPCPRLL